MRAGRREKVDGRRTTGTDRFIDHRPLTIDLFLTLNFTMQSTSIIARTPASWLTLSLLAGVGSHLLFNDADVGLNVLIWAALLELCWLGLHADQRPTRQQRLLLGLALCFAAGFAWRTSPFLRLADAIGLVTCAVLIPLVREESLLTLRLHRFLGGVRNLVARVGAGLIPAAFDAQEEARERGAPSVLLPAARGMVLAVPAVADIRLLAGLGRCGLRETGQQPGEVRSRMAHHHEPEHHVFLLVSRRCAQPEDWRNRLLSMGTGRPRGNRGVHRPWRS